MRSGRLTGGCLSLVLLLLPAGCGGSATPSTSPSVTDIPGTGGPAGPVRVTLGIYSGRPDPSWTLTDGEAARLEAALAALPGAVGQPPTGGLGYHGFTLDRPGSVVVAYRGAVAPPGEGRRAYLADPARTIERLLVETARSHVTDIELAEAERALAAP